MILIVEKWKLGSVLIRALLTAASILTSSLSLAAVPVGSTVDTGGICMPEGTYRTVGGGITVFSLKTCFSRPVRDTDSREMRVPPTKKSPRDTFNGERVLRYDYHDALYQCVKRNMRLPTVNELKALFAYANRRNGSATASKFVIVAPENDSRYPGGLYGWGGDSRYWSHTRAGNGVHKVVNLSNGQMSIDHDPHRNYVSCVR
jgi:hypothetical protein